MSTFRLNFRALFGTVGLTTHRKCHVDKIHISLMLKIKKRHLIACVAGAKRGGGGRKERNRGKGRELPLSPQPPSLFPFLHGLPLSTPATQASHLKNQTSQVSEIKSAI